MGHVYPISLLTPIMYSCVITRFVTSCSFSYFGVNWKGPFIRQLPAFMVCVIWKLRKWLDLGKFKLRKSLQWRYNERDGVSNHQPHDCLLNRRFRHKIKKTSKVRVTGLCERNSSVTGDFPAQRTSNAENVSIWWRHHLIRGSIQGWPSTFMCIGITPITCCFITPWATLVGNMQIVICT